MAGPTSDDSDPTPPDPSAHPAAGRRADDPAEATSSAHGATRIRTIVAALALVAYVSAVAVRDAGADRSAAILGFFAAVPVVVFALRRAHGTSRLAGVLAAVVLAALGAPDGHATVTFFGDVAVGIALLVVESELSFVVNGDRTPRGVAESLPKPRLALLRAVSVGWMVTACLVVFGGRFSAFAVLDPRTLTVSVTLATVFVAFVEIGRIHFARSLELGVSERLALFALVFTIGLFAALAAALASDVQPVRAFWGAFVFLALAARPILRARDAGAFAERLRSLTILALFGLGLAVAVGVAVDLASSASVVAACLAFACLVAGTYVRRVGTFLLPSGGTLLASVAQAKSVLVGEASDDAIRRALFELRAPLSLHAPPPVLFLLEPKTAFSVDAAAYLHRTRVDLPEGLVSIVSGEPELTLRRELLAGLEVRRPDLRRVLAWMERHDALTLTLVVRSGEREGLLLVPRGTRAEPSSLEEVRELRRLAESMASTCHGRALLERSHERELASRDEAERAKDEALRLARDLERSEGRHAQAAVRLARPASVGGYAALARLAADALDLRGRTGAPAVVVVPAGVDAVPHLAKVHLAGARRRGPFVVVDGTHSKERELTRWTTERTSPLALANGGTLALVDGACLPLDVQDVIARALSERRGPWDGALEVDVVPLLSTVRPPADIQPVPRGSGDATTDEGRLGALLAIRFEDALASPVTLPRLRERPEDLRSIVHDRLAREGLRTKGRPVGIDHAAYALLVEHPFVGDDRELAWLVGRLVQGAEGDVVRRDDVLRVLESPFADDGQIWPMNPRSHA
ncbi:MAG: hypothetical protein U0169_12170 [Polyangiaceae bacterium]